MDAEFYRSLEESGIGPETETEAPHLLTFLRSFPGLFKAVIVSLFNAEELI